MQKDLPDKGHDLRNRWRRRTIRALVFSQVVTVLSVGLFIAGVATYFADFNFGSGGDTRGGIILSAALCLGVITVIGDLYAILAAWITARCAGTPWWLVIAILLPVLEAMVFALIWRAL